METSGTSRREMLKQAACGFGSLALAGLLGDAARSAPTASLSSKVPHHRPRAKRIIFLFMQGGVSQVDSFDYKPELQANDGVKKDFHVARKVANMGKVKATTEALMASPWKFKQYGQCGQWVSDLFPHIAQHVDDLCMIHGMHTNGVAHGPSTLCLHTGITNLIRPSMGSWVMYGLGTENQSLPGFITLSPSPANGGPRNYSNAFLPAIYQGTKIGTATLPIKEAGIRFLENKTFSRQQQQKQFALLQQINRTQKEVSLEDNRLDATIASYELAFRMQESTPRLLDISGETKETMKMYGIGEKNTDNFGRQCLLARRFAEADVRYIQVNYGDASNNPAWDQHSKIKLHKKHALAVDKPIAGLLADLKQRGLLEDTLIWWGSEFGRNPFTQGNQGRDHNPNGFTTWLAGGGVKPGFSYGATDELGHQAVLDKMHMHDLHATILHLLGLNHEKLTYRYAGRDFRLTDVHGQVAKEIFA